MIPKYLIALTIAGGLAVAGAAHAGCPRDDGGRCKMLVAKARHIRSRDPEAEARAELAAGDFKLGRSFRYGDPVVVASSSLPGVDCRVWPSELVGKEITGDDVIEAGESEHEAAAEAFLIRYNRTKVASPLFPYRDICAVAGQKPLRQYDGPVTTFAQAARSGDVAKLAAVTGGDVNAADVFGLTPVGWAMTRHDLAMALALIDRGADVNATGDAGAPTPLGQAILDGDYAAARALRAKGARLQGETGLCPRPETYRMIFAPPVPVPAPEDADAVLPVGQCSWAGLLLQRGQGDLLAELLKTRAVPDPHRPGEPIDGYGDVLNGFKQAILDGDMALAGKLAPWVGENDDYPSGLLEWLYRHEAYDILADELSRHPGFAHSPTEAHLWEVALDARQYRALAMLWDYGDHLNHLTAAQLPACESAVADGDQARVYADCIQPSFERHDAIVAAVKAGDAAAFKALVADSSSLREDYTLRLYALVAHFGTADMLAGLPPIGKEDQYGHLETRPGDGGGYSLRVRHMYDGALKAEADAFVDPRLTWPEDGGYWFNDPMGSAVARDDVAMAKALGGLGFASLSRVLAAAADLGSGIDRNVPGATSVFVGEEDTEHYPNRPGDAVWAKLQRFVPLVVPVEGPDGLHQIVHYAAAYGWNDVVQLALDNGFDAAATQNPGDIWDAWGGDSFEGLCKPSTGRMLLKSGLRIEPPAPDMWPLLHVMAAVCRDPASLRFIITEAGLDVNQRFDGNETALDEATFRRHPRAVAVLTELGGKPGKVLFGDAIVAERKADIDQGADPDFWSWP